MRHTQAVTSLGRSWPSVVSIFIFAVRTASTKFLCPKRKAPCPIGSAAHIGTLTQSGANPVRSMPAPVHPGVSIPRPAKPGFLRQVYRSDRSETAAFSLSSPLRFHRNSERVFPCRCYRASGLLQASRALPSHPLQLVARARISLFARRLSLTSRYRIRHF